MINQTQGGKKMSRKIVVVVLIALVAFAFSPVAHTAAQGKVVRITLIDENGSGEDGSAQLTDQGNGSTKVELIMLNTPEGAVQPASVHEGTCSSLDADVAFPLESVKASKSTSTVQSSLADLTKDKHAIAVYKSDADKTVISCGNLPTGAVATGSTMTLDLVMTTLLDNANELLGTIKKKEVDASNNAYDAYHATFAAHEDEIKAKSADSQAKLEEAMHGVQTALNAGDFSKAEDAANELVDTVKEIQTNLSSGAGTSNMSSVLNDLASAANDLVRETKNADKDGAQAAYNDFHDKFAANEDAIKTQNPDAQAHIEAAMHEVRDALAAGDFTKANTSSTELVNEVNDAMKEFGVSPTKSNLANTGVPDLPLMWVALVVASLALLIAGRTLQRRTKS
jgi:hypothetical protein